MPTLAGLGGLAITIALWTGALPALAPDVPASAVVVGTGGIGAGVALLGLLAIGVAVIPSAIVRVIGSERRIGVALAAGVPLIGAALATAAPLDDPRGVPTQPAPLHRE